jgi:hypothetical protein
MITDFGRAGKHEHLEDVTVAGDNNDLKPTTWTLGAIKERNMALEGYCETEGCGHFYVFDVDGLIERFGSEWLVPEYLPVECMECGGRLKFMLGMTPPEAGS